MLDRRPAGRQQYRGREGEGVVVAGEDEVAGEVVMVDGAAERNVDGRAESLVDGLW